jgi:primosomal protein N' (replication factor Y)
MYAQVAVNVPQVSGAFDYAIPAEMAGEIVPGCLVVVPFGRQTVQGIVLHRMEEPSVPDTRLIQALLDPQPVITAQQMRLAGWLAEQALAPLSACLELMLPPGLSQQADTLYRLAGSPAAGQVESQLSPAQQKLLGLLRQRGELRGRQIESALPHQEWRLSAQALVRRGWVQAHPVLLAPSVRPKTVNTVQLAVAPEVAEKHLPDLGRGEALTRRQAALRFLMSEPWPVNVSWVYAASRCTLADLTRLAEAGLVILGESETWRDPLEKVEFVLQQPPALTPGQQTAWNSLEAGMQACSSGQDQKPFLLHGVTGSGKTEIYLRAVAETLRQGRGAIVMVPEISLTPQTVRRFLARFPGQVGLVHSNLSPGERYDTWRRARAGLLKVIVGPRSALFAPLPDVGLVVVDEFHDESYYQDEMEPRYHAVRAAVAYAGLANAVVVLGSATPEVAWLFRARQESWPVLELPLRILAHRQAASPTPSGCIPPSSPPNPPACVSQAVPDTKPGGEQQDSINLARAGSLPATASASREEGDNTEQKNKELEPESLPLPKVTVVDMRQELKAGNRSIFSRTLLDALRQTLDASQQAILFLNRRGSATYVFCRQCGYSLRCPRCDLPLTFHATGEVAGSLVCHTCGYRRQMPKTCPQCGSAQIRQFGTGTEKVEAEVQKEFPGVRTLRWDYESTRQKGAHDILLSHFVNHRADVLVGTQMLAKGLDLPLITLVGVVLADVGLNLPDYRAPERTFQLLVQVAGRAGRSALGGQVVMQTFMPDHYAIQAAAGHDYTGFYRRELAERRKLGYPPFARLLRLEYRHADSAQAEKEARRMAAQVQRWMDEGDFSATHMIGPAPCFYARQAGLYRWQIVLSGPNPQQILLRHPLGPDDHPRSGAGNWRVEVDPVNLL